MNIAFIGARGSGKSTIAQAIASKLGWPLVVLDDLICQEHHNQSIAEIVQKHGWHYFRNLEFHVLQKIASRDTSIIDCGGGVVTDLDQTGQQIYSKRKVAALKQNSLIVWLIVSPTVACERIGDGSTRPPLGIGKTAQEEMKEMIALRTPWYKKASDYSFDTTKLSKEEIVFEVEKIAP